MQFPPPPRQLQLLSTAVAGDDGCYVWHSGVAHLHVVSVKVLVEGWVLAEMFAGRRIVESAGIAWLVQF